MACWTHFSVSASSALSSSDAPATCSGAAGELGRLATVTTTGSTM